MTSISLVATAVTVVAVFVVAWAAVWAGRRLLHRSLAALDIVSEENRTVVHARAREVLRGIQLVAYGIAAIVGISVAVSRLGASVPAWRPRDIVEWVLSHGVHIAAIVIAAYITLRAARLTIEHLQFKAARTARGVTDPERGRRAATLGGTASRPRSSG